MLLSSILNEVFGDSIILNKVFLCFSFNTIVLLKCESLSYNLLS